MSRKSITLNNDLLKSIIEQCETTKQYKNQSELFNDVAKEYGKHIGQTPSGAWVFTKIQSLGLVIQTQKGRIGRQKGETVTTERKSRGDKIARNPEALAALKSLKGEVLAEKNGKFLPIFKRVENGSLKSAVVLKCLDCTAYQPNEVRHCPCTNCPLFVFRPYQQKSTDNSLLSEIES